LLWERKFRGWAIYIDADAVIADQDFDLRAYTQDKSQFAAVLSYKGEAHWWQVNCGVMILNFAHPWRLARPKGWFQTRAAIRKRQRICGPGADFIFLQTCDPDRYFAIWAAGSQTVRRYCAKQGFGYEAYIGIKSGYFPWHATYNRIFLFKEPSGDLAGFQP
jgi:hypothetical protein